MYAGVSSLSFTHALHLVGKMRSSVNQTFQTSHLAVSFHTKVVGPKNIYNWVNDKLDSSDTFCAIPDRLGLYFS
jgi:hypothetical protein